VVLLAAAGLGVAAALLCLLLGASALALGARAWVRPAALTGAVVAVAAAVGWAARALLRTAWTDEAAARTVAGGEPALRSALVSSVELARERAAIEASGRFSVALVDAHLAGTAERARAVDLSRAIPGTAARRGGAAVAVVLAAHGVALLLVGGAVLGRGYARLFTFSAPGGAAAALDPITGDIELTFRFPAYMRREPKTLSGTGGEIRAPKGTEVELRTRADRKVEAAELEVDLSAAAAPAPAPARPEGGAAGGGAESKGAAQGRTEHLALAVQNGRDLSGRLVVDQGGSYRFRFLDRKGKALVAGPSIPIAVEPDAFPEVRITAPERELEVDPGASVRVDWQAEDDVGVSKVTLVVVPPGPGPQVERRRILRDGIDVRRDAGSADLDLGPERLSEGEAVSYWIEVLDDDAVSGPKKGMSETQRVKVYSEADHRRQVLEKARQVFEEMLALLGDRLETFAAGRIDSPDRLTVADQLDRRTRELHEKMRATAREIRHDRAGPRPLAAALDNVAGQLRFAEQRVTSARAQVAGAFRIRVRPDPTLVRSMQGADAQLDQELEKGVLYLEQLLDKQRAEDMVRLAKDLASKRRELADLMEKYRAAPTEAAKKELLSRISRMRDRVKELLARMSEAAKGFNDEHMNAEAMAELQKSQDLMGGLDEIEKKLAQGDVEGAMKALDKMASAMDQLLAGMQRNAGQPDEKSRALMKEMLAFKDALEKVQAEQRNVAGDTAAVKKKYAEALQKKAKDAEARVKKLQRLAGEARHEVEQAQPGVTYRAELEYDQAREGLADLERALGMRELQAAYETAQRATPSVERLARFLEEDIPLAEQNPAYTRRDAGQVRDAQGHVRQAVPKAREVRDELSRLFPDPRQVLSQPDQQKLDQLSRRQGQLEQQAGELQRKLSELAQKAPIFPPSAMGQLGESRGHMGQATAQLGNRNPQRGHGEQQLALDALERFRKGLEEAAKQQGSGGSGGGFPFPFADSGGEQGGEGFDPSREKVKIPGAEAHRVPEEFRKDLLEAMKQGTPERYRGDVQRYYEELVK
jgi:hypothetical protein